MRVRDDLEVKGCAGGGAVDWEVEVDTDNLISVISNAQDIQTIY
mgnify:CR=1 FL=1